MTRRDFSFGLTAALQASPSSLRVAAFRADVTPAPGEPLIWVDPTLEVLDPLSAKGFVLDGPGGRAVLCAIDWCGLGGFVHRIFVDALARAVNTSPTRVAVVAVHQHTAPYAEGGGYELLARLPKPPLMLSRRFLDTITGRLAQAAARAVDQLTPCDTIGFGVAHPERIASARRIFVDGKLITRFSSGAKDPNLAALPEGDIDTRLRTITFFQDKRPLVRLHHYACHPQAFCCNGQVSSDFVGAAREAVEKDEGVPQIYLTGCAGDVTAGKYNDGSESARRALAQRLEAALRASIVNTATNPLRLFHWKSASVQLPGPDGAVPAWPPTPDPGPTQLYRQAIRAAFPRRRDPLAFSRLALGDLQLVILPGEPMLHFQRLAPDALIAGYSDISPGYICPDSAFPEGGYEPSAANAGPGAEAIVQRTISALLAP